MTPDQLRNALRVLKMTQQDLADALGVHLRTVGRWVSGDVEMPKVACLAVMFLLATWPSASSGDHSPAA
jgi:DNA-binding transcriptional regulator YiaG